MCLHVCSTLCISVCMYMYERSPTQIPFVHVSTYISKILPSLQLTDLALQPPRRNQVLPPPQNKHHTMPSPRSFIAGLPRTLLHPTGRQRLNKHVLTPTNSAYTAYTCTTQCVFFLGHCWPASHIHTDKQRLHSLHMHHTMRLFPRSLLACLAHNPQRAPQLLLLLCHVPPLLLPC